MDARHDDVNQAVADLGSSYEHGAMLDSIAEVVVVVRRYVDGRRFTGRLLMFYCIRAFLDPPIP